MSLIKGCQEGKGTPRLVEVKCPKCGQWVEVFVKMGGAIGQTGTLVSDETCDCGYVLPAGSYETDYEGLVCTAMCSAKYIMNLAGTTIRKFSGSSC